MAARKRGREERGERKRGRDVISRFSQSRKIARSLAR
jgi:hypothetical protein